MKEKIDRRQVLKLLGLSGFYAISPGMFCTYARNQDNVSVFATKLSPIGRILETEGYYVWCNSPVYDHDGKVHVYYSRWPEKYGMGGWIHQCEIAHAVADHPESDFEFVDVVMKPTAATYYSTTCHNPSVYIVDGRYCLFFMGNSNGKTDTKRIGLAISDTPYGPWHISEQPLLEPGPAGSWDDHCTTNPAFLKLADGTCRLYYKSWNTAEYDGAKGAKIRANRKYGIATSPKPEGPYSKIAQNPVIDFSTREGNQQLEDAFVWLEDGKFKLIARDMGFYSHEHGLYFESDDGIHWPSPQIAYYPVSHYVDEPPPASYLNRFGRLERPQLLMKNGRPQYLFCATQGGKFQTASGFVLKINS